MWTPETLVFSILVAMLVIRCNQYINYRARQIRLDFVFACALNARHTAVSGAKTTLEDSRSVPTNAPQNTWYHSNYEILIEVFGN